MKNLLKKAMRRARLTYDGILTILIEIEIIINSRPLTYISDKPDESFITSYQLIYGRHINEKFHKSMPGIRLPATIFEKILAAKLQT